MATAKIRKPKLKAKIRKEADLEAHVRTQWVMNGDFVEIRDFVPSTGEYGRGFTIERHLLAELVAALAELVPSKAEIPGQLSLFDKEDFRK